MKKNSNWNTENIGDQNGKVAIVTGSSSGIGLETARVLANKNAHVIIAVRNLTKGQAAESQIKLQNPNAMVDIMELDLASLESVASFARAFKNKYSQLNFLVNNAGVMVPPKSKTTDGFELQFGTNHLGHFALTGHLIDVLKNTPNARIVNVSSMAHKAGNLDFNDLQWDSRDYKKWNAYGDSKIANLYFTSQLGKKLNNTAVKVTAAHPGWTATELQRNTGFTSFLNNFFAQTVDMGALPTLRALADDTASSNDYFGPKGLMEMRGLPVRVSRSDLAKNESIAEKLWTVSEQLTGVSY